MSWAERTSNVTKTATPVVKAAPITTTVETIRVRNKITGVVKDVPKGTPLWMDELVPGDTPLSESPTVVSAPSVVSTFKKAQPTLVEKEAEVEPEMVYEQGVDYPYGFDSYQEFRDKTRIIAEQARNGIVIVSGSSVTGRSFKTGKPFHAVGHITENSDIDVGIVDPDLYYDESQVNDRGFPVPRTSLGNAEILAGSGMREKNLQMGIKVWEGEPEDRYFIVRPHTPRGERRRPVNVNGWESQKKIGKELRERKKDKGF